MAAQQFQQAIGLQGLAADRQGPGGGNQIGQLRLQLGGGVIPQAGHHLGEAFLPLAPTGRVGRQQRFSAEAPGLASGEQQGQGGAEIGGLRVGDAQVVGGWRQPHAHEHLQQLARPQHRLPLPLHRQGGGLQRRQQLKLALQLPPQPLGETRRSRLGGQQLVEATQGQKQLRARRRQLAVAQF